MNVAPKEIKMNNKRKRIWGKSIKFVFCVLLENERKETLVITNSHIFDQQINISRFQIGKKNIRLRFQVEQ